MLNSRHLHWLVERKEVIKLLERTIRFLRSLAPISSTLAVDADVLLHVLNRISPGMAEKIAAGGRLNASFSSQ